MDIVFFGIQGSGKGTQAKLLAKEFGYTIFEAGAELRKLAASGSELGLNIRSYIDHGHLVPHGIIMEVVREAITNAPDGTKFIFDGVPRDMDQMQDFNDIMEQAGRQYICVMIAVDAKAAVQRITGRAKAEKRKDDLSEDVVRKRMQIYREKTMPVIEKYRQGGKIVEVPGDGEVQEVYGRLKKGLNLAA